MKIRTVQFAIQPEPSANLERLLNEVSCASRGEWLIAAEGALSGYFPDHPGFPHQLDRVFLFNAAQRLSDAARAAGVHLIYGSAWPQGKTWYNAVLLETPAGRQVYHKINLARKDRGRFSAGNGLPVFTCDAIVLGVQICREVYFPEQWKALKRQGAQVLFHINNAIHPLNSVWRHLLIARAFENQAWVISVNNADPAQTLPGMVISPAGDVLYESRPGCDETAVIEIDPTAASNVYLNDERRDVVDLIHPQRASKTNRVIGDQESS